MNIVLIKINLARNPEPGNQVIIRIFESVINCFVVYHYIHTICLVLVRVNIYFLEIILILLLKSEQFSLLKLLH